MHTLSTPISAPATALAEPVSQKERIPTIDILRGVALLGILLMNIPLFALPQAVVQQQVFTTSGDTNYWTNLVVSILFEGKMRGFFSLLFGAGLILFTARKEAASGGSIGVADLYFRRMLWLVLFGVADAFILLWIGDVLYHYGLLGLLLFAVRNSAPRRLLLGAVLCFAFIAFLSWWNYAETRQTRQKYLTAVSQEKLKKPLTEQAKEDKTAWETIEKKNSFDQKKTDKEIKAMRGNYASVWNHIRPQSVSMESVFFYHYLWDVLGMMLLGMALLKWGVLTNEVRPGIYWLMLLLGYGIGLPLGYWAVGQQLQEKLHLAQYVDNQWLSHSVTYDVRRISMVMGHMGVLMLLIRSGLFDWLWRSLAAVGQMAFTNYVMHTLFCTGIFFGYGLGYYGSFQFYQLYFVVAGIWLFQMLFSPLWLRYFYFGPLEWVWRSLTYWKQQPMRRPGTTPPVVQPYPGI